jgi:hypothetical protein
MKLVYVILSALVSVIYGYLWYMGESIPAWNALIWVLMVFFQDLTNYLDEVNAKLQDVVNKIG